MELQEALHHWFGYPKFRAGQRDIVEAVLDAQPVVAVMPTGAGKSLCYQLPAALSDGLTLVVSPLIALMKDQVDSLDAFGVPAAAIHSHVSARDRHLAMSRAQSGELKLLYVAPERLRSHSFMREAQNLGICRLAVDEAHCISQWGHDFRPDYLRIPELVEHAGIRQTCAFTATATPEVRRDIIAALSMAEPAVFVHGFRRDNLEMHVVHIKHMVDKLEGIAQLAQKEESGIVYAATRKSVEAVAAELSSRGIRTACYHAGLNEEERTNAQQAFMSGEIPVIVATNAFGMGVDKPDIRFVAHHDLPGSMEAYYQEAGRAGRDGTRATCAIFFSYADTRIHEFFISRIGEDRDPENRARNQAAVTRLQELERAKLKRMVSYCYVEGCRHETILRYFGDSAKMAVPCGDCDNCLRQEDTELPDWTRAVGKKRASARSRSRTPVDTPGERDRLTGPARDLAPSENLVVRKILSAVARGRGQLSRTEIAALARGTGRTLPDALRESSTYGVLKGTPASQIQSIIDALAAEGSLIVPQGRPSVPTLTPAGVAWMKGQKSGRLRLIPFGEDDADLTHDPLLFSLLSARRTLLATESEVPPYVVAHDAVLRRMAATRPRTVDDLLQIKGIGPATAERYGAEWLEIIESHEGAG